MVERFSLYLTASCTLFENLYVLGLLIYQNTYLSETFLSNGLLFLITYPLISIL